MEVLPSVEYLNECFDVNFYSGEIRWKLRPSSHFSTLKGWRIHTTKCYGKIANVMESKGYLVLPLNGKWVKAHRVLFKMFHGFEPPQIDHLNRNRSDNSISNLVPSDYTSNSRNHKRRRAGMPTGVHYQQHPWERFWCCWRSLEGKQCAKSFSVPKYGYDRAFQLACEYRAKMIAELNKQGAGYSETHGL